MPKKSDAKFIDELARGQRVHLISVGIVFLAAFLFLGYLMFRRDFLSMQNQFTMQKEMIKNLYIVSPAEQTLKTVIMTQMDQVEVLYGYLRQALVMLGICAFLLGVILFEHYYKCKRLLEIVSKSKGPVGP